MNPKPEADRRRSALRAALLLSALPGCSTRPLDVRPDAPDLLRVSAVAPSINAELAGKPPSARRSSTTDPALTPASATPTTDPAPGASDAITPSIPQSAAPYPIDLEAALRLADGQNPTIGEARVLILGALAERQAARALLLPYLNAGANYHDHVGPLQRSSGTILPLTEQSLYFGGGARTLAAESVAIPAVNIFSPLTDAIFEPLAAQQRVVGARFNASDAANKVLLEVASLYIDLVGAEAILEARRENAGEADRLATSVSTFARMGQGRQADADRAEAERQLFRVEIVRAEERVAVASARLAQRLNLDPSAQLRPLVGPLEAIELIDPGLSPEDLIRSAISRRPDLAAREALVSQAEYQVRKEKARPLLPTIWLGFSGGAFGGGSNLASTPLSAFAGRTNFDVRAYWTVLNLGAGNAALISQRRAQAGQAMAERSRVINQVRDEVATARAEAIAIRGQVANARSGLRSAEDGFRQDQARLRESLSRPIEALDSLRLLADARVALIRAITRANRNQFALFVSLGAPPPLGTPPNAGAGP